MSGGLVSTGGGGDLSGGNCPGEGGVCPRGNWPDTIYFFFTLNINNLCIVNYCTLMA